MQKNDEIILNITDMTSDGSGIGKYDGMAIFVPLTAIGDTARVKILKVKKTYAFGKLTEIIEPSPDRAENRCPSFSQCGGCVYRHISYAAECRIKTDKVYEAIKRIGGADMPPQPIICSENTEHYRNKAQFPVGRDKDGKVVTGFYAGRTHTIIPNRNCLLGMPMNEKVMVSPEIQSEAVVLPQIVSIKQASQRMGLPEYYIRRLCREAKQRGIRVILDGVFNHTGSQSRYFNADGFYPGVGAAQSTDSPYFNWFSFHPWPTDYDAWWGIMTLPAVQENESDYRDFIIRGQDSVVRHWLRAGASGWRLDVADELPDDFIAEIRTAMEETAPDSFLLGEVWEDATTKFGFDHRRTYLLGKGLDSVMNYPFKNAVLDFVKGKPAEQAANEILTICEHYPAPAMDTALNFLSTHDTERALTVIADEPANGRGREWQSGRCVTGDAYEEGLLRLRMAYAIIYTLPGVPCLYYGDEIAMQGYRDPFNRAFFRWDAHEQRLRPVLAQLAQLRHTCEAFRTGKLNVLRAEGGILHYQRIGEAETAEIIVNRTEHIIVETLASGKSTEVNPMGFTIVVEEVGHNPNHSYYDYI